MRSVVRWFPTMKVNEGDKEGSWGRGRGGILIFSFLNLKTDK